MFTRKKTPLPEQPSAPAESPGIHLKAGLPERGEMELKVSEKVAITLTPWLAGLLGLSLCAAGVWLWFSFTPQQVTPLTPAAETQPRK